MLRPQQYTSKVYNVNNTWVTFRNFILNLDTTFFFFFFFTANVFAPLIGYQSPWLLIIGISLKTIILIKP